MQAIIHQPMPGHGGKPSETGSDNAYAKVRRTVAAAGMTGVQMRVVVDLENGRFKGLQAPVDLFNKVERVGHTI